MIIVTVVRDFTIYNQLVKENPFNKGAQFFTIDNTVTNKGLGTRYNEFLDNYDYNREDWIVFCHEDWEVKENLEPILSTLDKGAFHGPVGVDFESTFRGRFYHCHRDGSGLSPLGRPCKTGTIVSTFDCLCLIVHSSLIQQYNLRFDENLKFDLYVEDFCIRGSETYGIDSKIVCVQCCHHSRRRAAQSFYDALDYVRGKYKHPKKMYISTCGLIVGPRMKGLAKKIKKFLYQNVITSHGKRLIKICKIPIWDKKIKQWPETM
jgi:hypothetical protein